MGKMKNFLKEYFGDILIISCFILLIVLSLTFIKDTNDKLKNVEILRNNGYNHLVIFDGIQWKPSQNGYQILKTLN